MVYADNPAQEPPRVPPRGPSGMSRGPSPEARWAHALVCAARVYTGDPTAATELVEAGTSLDGERMIPAVLEMAEWFAEFLAYGPPEH